MAKWDINFDFQIDPYDKSILELCIEIEAYKRSVLKIPLPPGISRKLNKLNIIRQIKGTTGIEGNTLTEEEIADTIDNPDSKEQISREKQEAINANDVIKFIREEVNKNNSDIITEELIKKIHFLTTKKCNYPDNVPGEYRKINVRAGKYSPPDYTEIPTLMKRFINFINSRKMREKYNPLIRAIIAHFYLISIHPFADGNGRTSRGLEAYILYQGKYNIRGFYSLANFYYKNRNEYINQLNDARFKYNGDLTQFIKFSLKGYLEELEYLQEEILSFVKAILFLDYIGECFIMEEINGRCKAILEYMIREKKTITVSEYKGRKHYLIRELYKNIKTDRTIMRDIKNMEELKLIRIENKTIKPNINLMNAFLD